MARGPALTPVDSSCLLSRRWPWGDPRGEAVPVGRGPGPSLRLKNDESFWGHALAWERCPNPADCCCPFYFCFHGRLPSTHRFTDKETELQLVGGTAESKPFAPTSSPEPFLKLHVPVPAWPGRCYTRRAQGSHSPRLWKGYCVPATVQAFHRGPLL